MPRQSSSPLSETPDISGGAQKVTFDEAIIVSQERAAEVVALDEALKEFERD